MKSTVEEEKQNKRKGIAVSIAVHAALLIIFFFVIAWRMPDPPPKGSVEGIEIGFMAASSQASSEEVIEEVPEEIVEDVVAQDDLVNADLENPHKIKKNEEQKDIKKTETPKKQEPNPDNLFPGKDKDGKDKDGKDKDGKDKNGGGGVLNLPGWVFEYVPADKDPSSESGHVIFNFKIDETGKVTNVTNKEVRNLSPTTVAFYKKKLYASRFKPKNADVEPEEGEEGTLRFNVNTK